MTPTPAVQRMLMALASNVRRVEVALKYGSAEDFALATRDLAEEAAQLAKEADRAKP